MQKKYLGLAILMMAGLTKIPAPINVRAASCPDVKILYARGSGGDRWTDANYLAFHEALDSKLKLTDLNYEFLDIDYPAMGINLDNFWDVIGAYVGTGDTYQFGKSVDEGVTEMVRQTQACPGTRFVLAGYSQGAMVVSKAIHSIDSDKVIYAATFGDPKLYLPEGKALGAWNLSGTSAKNTLRTGMQPEACKNRNLSDYRIYVPDCYAYEGLLGSYRPYEPEGYQGKVGVWCNKYDVFCSSYLSISSHVSYTTDGIYADASKLIFAKITEAMGVSNTYVSAHDTAFLIDTTGSMAKHIAKYRAEALRFAKETLEAGGRVALYDYRDIADGYRPVKHCDFETCDLATFQRELESLNIAGGGDIPESLLSASLTTMQELEWKFGSTKSLVVLIDAGFHSPDLDGTTFVDVVRLSKEIDPVNFYVIAPSDTIEDYYELTAATDGATAELYGDLSDLGKLTDYVMARFDSLPRVEEDFDSTDYDATVPVIEITGAVVGEGEFDDTARGTGDGDDTKKISVRFVTDATRILAIVNDEIMGVAEVDDILIREEMESEEGFKVGEITLGGIDDMADNRVTLVPLNETRRGMGQTIEIAAGRGDSGSGILNAVSVRESDLMSTKQEVILPKAPKTGRGQ